MKCYIAINAESDWEEGINEHFWISLDSVRNKIIKCENEIACDILSVVM